MSMMPEVNNLKRKRSSYIVNPDGNCTPSDSESEDEEYDRLMQRKIVRRQSVGEPAPVEDDEASHSNSSTESAAYQGNNQLLYAALRKIQELEHELAELDDADYDSGHHDDDDDDEGNSSDFDEEHDHHNDILNGQPEALGFAFCVKETFEYLANQGLTPDNPVVTSLRERFLGQCDQFK